VSATDQPEFRTLALHGQRVAYLQAGSGPVVLLIHGITSNSSNWRRVIPALARRFTVIAPDLIGHGRSDKPMGDYSLGSHAACLRDLLVALGHKRATIVGHSLGGGIAMQLFYQHPERCERLVLVDSGGLGREVSMLLRAATLPGAEVVLPVLAASRVLAAARRAGGVLGGLGMRAPTDIEEMAHGHATLSDGQTRSAFVHTLRAVVEPGGQRVDATNRLYLVKNVPLLLIWGEHDSLIPVSHGHRTHERVPGSRLEIFAQSGHFPQLDEPQKLVSVLTDFIDSTAAATLDADHWRDLSAVEGS
jgi:pimeloyl-ACP methyl ester carboxylesterase